MPTVKCSAQVVIGGHDSCYQDRECKQHLHEFGNVPISARIIDRLIAACSLMNELVGRLNMAQMETRRVDFIIRFICGRTAYAWTLLDYSFLARRRESGELFVFKGSVHQVDGELLACFLRIARICRSINHQHIRIAVLVLASCVDKQLMNSILAANQIRRIRV